MQGNEEKQGLFRGRRGILSIIGTAFMIALLVYAFIRLDHELIAGELMDADLALLALSVIVYLVSWPLRGKRFDDIMECIGYPCGTYFMTAAMFISQTMNLVVPARAGDVARVYLVKSEKNAPYSSSFAGLAVERFFDLTAVLFIATLSLFFIVLMGVSEPMTLLSMYPGLGLDFSWGEYILVFAGAVIFLALGVFYLERRGALKMLWEPLSRFIGDIRLVAGDTRYLISIMNSSLVIWALDVFTAVLVLLALGVDVSFVSLVVIGGLAVSVGNIAKILPLSQGGIGLYEFSFAAVLAVLSPVAPGLALGAALLDHAVKNVVTVVGGVLSSFSLNVGWGSLAGEKTEHR